MRHFLVCAPPAALLTALMLLSCQDKGDNPTLVTLGQHDIHKVVVLEVIPSNQLPGSPDTLLYAREMVEWNTPRSDRDTLKADSLAQAFLKDSLELTDMWFPAVGTVCSDPIRTENLVTIRLAAGESPPAGFTRGKLFNGCYALWRHYKYGSVRIEE